MTEPQIEAPAKPRRKAAPPKLSPYEGMQTKPCADACTAGRCVITLKGNCGSPKCGGPRADQMQEKAVVRRFAEAKAFIAHAKIDRGRR